MRFREIKHLIMQEARLDELRMSPSALEAFAKSPAAQGIQAGFEAELIFRGAAEEGTGEGGPDMDQDTTIDSIDELRSFFEENNSYRQVNQLIEEIENDGWLDYYYERQAAWVQENTEERMDSMFDDWLDDNVEDLVREALEEAKEYNDKEIDNIIKAGLSSYREGEWNSRETYDQMASIYQDYKIDVAEKAREQFNEDHEDEVRDELESEFDGDDVDFGDFLRERFGNRYASTIWEEYQGTVDWPHYHYEDDNEGGFNEYAAENIASDLKHLLGMDVTYSTGYHSARRKPNLWIVEPDSSLEPDDSRDMGAEIVSPPMPLSQCLEKMESLFTWAQGDGNAYANSSTGFHMGVSLPITGGQVDFVKLALFLGDEYVLEAFDRSSNTYAEAAMKKIRGRIRNQTTKIDEAMKLMHNGLIELAERAIMGSTGDGFGKYTSINPKGAYIEFRSAGGEDYIEDFKKAKTTLLRYAQAMSVAANPAAERQEYYKKLYKLISPPSGNAALDLFARFSSGNMTAEELKTQWAKAALEKDAPELTKTSNWKVYDTEKQQYLPNYQYNGYTESEALALFKQAHAPGSSMEDFKKYMQHMKWELRNVSASTGKWAIVNKDTGETLEVVGSETRGPVADMAADVYGKQGINYYIEPVPSDTPKPKLSRRAELAKRIHAGKEKAQGGPQYKVFGSNGLLVRDWIFRELDDDAAIERTKTMLDSAGMTGKFKLVKMTPAGQQEVTVIDQSEEEAGSNATQWRVTNRTTGDSSVITAPSRLRANAMVMDLANRMNLDSVDFDIEPYDQPSTPTAQSPQRQWQAYRVSTGTRIGDPFPGNSYGMALVDFRNRVLSRTSQDPADFDIREVHAQSAQPQAQQTQPQTPQQVVTDAGIPMWELYVRETGQAVNRFPDHHQTAAWSTARQWLRDAHAPESTWTAYSVRPLMQQG